MSSSPLARPAAAALPTLDLVEQGLRRGRRVRFLPARGELGAAQKGGEWVVVEPVAPSQVFIGDLVLVALEEGLAIYRVGMMEVQRAAPAAFAAWCTLRHEGDGSELQTDARRVLGRLLGVERGGSLVALPAPSSPPASARPGGLTGGLGLSLLVAIAALLMLLVAHAG